MQSVFNYAATELHERNDINCQICKQNSKLLWSQAPGSGTFSWCGVTPDNYLFLTMTIGSIGHPPLSPAAKGLEFLSEGLTFRFVTIHFCNTLVKKQKRSNLTTSSFCQDRPAPSPRSRGGDIDCGLLLLLLFLLLLLPLFLLRTPVTWPASDLIYN